MLRSPMIFDIQNMVKLNPDWSVQFNYREANMAAYSFAKLALSYNGDLVWMEKCPHDVLPVVVSDKRCSHVS